ncbi:MAG: hypothetical protein WA584_18895 [Pyrinomonadaceae bacterium]
MIREESNDLQIILNEMFASKKDLSLGDVRAFQEKYPEYKREIAEAYTDWREFEFFVLADEEAATIDETLSESKKKTIENVLAQFYAQSDETINDLRELAEKRGVTREVLLNVLGVSETLMRKLDRRNLKGIPRFIEEKLADVLRVSTESLQAFFALPSQLPKAARYKSKNAPHTLPKQPFAEAVKQDMELTAEQKRELLKLE